MFLERVMMELIGPIRSLGSGLTLIPLCSIRIPFRNRDIFEKSKSNKIFNTRQKGSCGRSLCECDAMLAKKHVAVKDVYTDDYHLFYSAPLWVPEGKFIVNFG